jgi:hypothetical protein
MTTPVLPPEIWAIIMYYKEQIEYRDDCTIGKKGMKLRSGRIIWSNETRVQRFMNKATKLAYNMGNHSGLKIVYLFKLIRDYYYFVKTIENEDTKKRIENLICSIEKKVIKFYWQLNNENYDKKYLTLEERDIGLELMSRCRFFIFKFDIIMNPDIDSYYYDVFYEEKYHIWTQCGDFNNWCK